MTNITFSNMVGLAATAMVINYSAYGEPIPQKDYLYDTKESIQQYLGQYDYYTTLSINNPIPISEQIEILHEFASSILSNIKDIEPEFSSLVDDNFWELV